MCQLQRNVDSEEPLEILFRAKMQLKRRVGESSRRSGDLLGTCSPGVPQYVLKAEVS